jgi:shikimate kinase
VIKELNKINDQKIALIGFMGSGKTTIGRLLSKQLGLAFIDTDEEIKICSGHPTVGEAFAFMGEEEFRQLETSVLSNAVKNEKTLISTGGGVVVRPENRELLAGYRIIFLYAPFEVIVHRLSSTEQLSRPLFRDIEVAQEIYNRRLSLYRRWATEEISGWGKSINEIVAEIARNTNTCG